MRNVFNSKLYSCLQNTSRNEEKFPILVASKKGNTRDKQIFLFTLVSFRRNEEGIPHPCRVEKEAYATRKQTLPRCIEISTTQMKNYISFWGWTRRPIPYLWVVESVRPSWPRWSISRVKKQGFSMRWSVDLSKQTHAPQQEMLHNRVSVSCTHDQQPEYVCIGKWIVRNIMAIIARRFVYAEDRPNPQGSAECSSRMLLLLLPDISIGRDRCHAHGLLSL